MQSGGAVLLVTKKIADIHSMGSNISHLGKGKSSSKVPWVGIC